MYDSSQSKVSDFLKKMIFVGVQNCIIADCHKWEMFVPNIG